MKKIIIVNDDGSICVRQDAIALKVWTIDDLKHTLKQEGYKQSKKNIEAVLEGRSEDRFHPINWLEYATEEELNWIKKAVTNVSGSLTPC